MTKKRLLLLIFIIISASYIFACGYLYFFQRNILYLIDKNLSAPQQLGLGNAKKITIQTVDNIKIIAWYVPPQVGKPMLLYFQGNSGTLNKRVSKFKDFASRGLGILAISYRGYGDSEGSPTEEGIYNDARAAVNYLKEQGFRNDNIILYGESLGTGVAVQMAVEQDFGAIILEAPYDSVQARASEIYPYFPINLLLKDRFLSIEKIGKINTPLLVFHSKNDNVMPIHHGENLFAVAGEPKKMIVFENYGHSKFDTKELASLVVEFVEKRKNQ